MVLVATITQAYIIIIWFTDTTTKRRGSDSQQHKSFRSAFSRRCQSWTPCTTAGSMVSSRFPPPETIRSPHLCHTLPLKVRSLLASICLFVLAAVKISKAIIDNNPNEILSLPLGQNILDVAICWNYLVCVDGEGITKYGLVDGKNVCMRLTLPPGSDKVKQLSATPRHLLAVTENGGILRIK